MQRKNIDLSRDLLNPNKILFSYGKMLEEVCKRAGNGGGGVCTFTPVAVEIHPTAKCNHKCVHCSYKERNESRVSLEPRIMDTLADSIIKMGVRAVYFSGGGEPTLYPGLASYIERLHNGGVECAILTNGSCFDQAGLIRVANFLNYIAVSVPGVDSDTFMAITGVNTMESVLSLPLKIKSKHGNMSPTIGARVILTNKNFTKVKDFLQVLAVRGFDYVLFKIVRDYEDNGQGLGKEEETVLRGEVNGIENVDANFTNIKSIFDYRSLPVFKGGCWTNQYGMIANVSTDGNVYPNIVEIDKKEYCIGSLYKEPLESMWNGKRHADVKAASNRKWLAGECRNCRAMAYNRIINEIQGRLPAGYDPFI